MVGLTPKGMARRTQIIDATLRLVARHGVGGTTLNRVAAEVGLTTPSLYGYFPNRRELLLEAMDTVFQRVRDLHHSAGNPNALERLREIGRAHSVLLSTQEAFPTLFFEFIAAPPDEDLRQVLGGRELTLVEELAEIVREGQQQGTIREEVDPWQTAWTLVSRAWTDDVVHLMGIREHWSQTRSERMLNSILDSIATPNPPRSLIEGPESSAKERDGHHQRAHRRSIG